MENNIIIIGAGASGLMAARTLAKAGKKVTVLEARNRTGGRINTIYQSSFFNKAELGAEFIHGDLPVTLNLLKEAGIASQAIEMQMWRYQDGKFVEEEEQAEGWGEVIEKLSQLQQDMPIAEFMQQNFGAEKYAGVTQSILQMVAGYDTADPAIASALALGNEWQHEDDSSQHHIPDGYCAMINYLAAECKANGGSIQLNAVAQHIHWQPGTVKVTTTDGAEYQAEKLIVALPLGVLQAKAGEQGAILFHPPVPAHQQAMQQIGFGNIIKILLEFDAPFWEGEAYGGVNGTAFMFTQQQIPTWWTQAQGNPLLTGWLGGNAALALKDKTDEEAWQLGLQSLAAIFGIEVKTLKSKLIAWRVANWTAEPYTRGSYAYDRVGSTEARETLNNPVDNTIYFTGEYLYSGPAMGTVEAALDSGLKAATMIK